jgi:nitroreductase
MKTKVLFLAIALFAILKLHGQISDNCVTKAVLTGYSEKVFTSEAVTDQQLDIILKCGIKAPSARNKQPWKFTVINDEATMKQIINDIVPGNILIIVSGIETEGETTIDFDCGLATENIFIAAHSLGLGARMYSGPVENINLKKELFQIPTGYKAVNALRIGNTDKTVDAVSAATPRKKFEEVVNYKK